MSWVGIATMGEPVGAEIAWAEDRLIMDALAARGIASRHVPWTATLDAWDGASMCVVRSVWDYTQQPEAFLEWTRRLEARVAMWNPAPLLRWNSHKSYLFELEARGVRLPPTWRVSSGASLDLATLVAEHGELVVKPIVDVSAFGAIRVRGAEDVPAAQAHLARLTTRGEALVQPFLRSIQQDGELSLLFFDGAFSHAVRKVPKAGDYRVQAMWGGRVQPAAPDGDEMALARRVMAGLEHPTLHARVDVVRDNEGRAALMELEVIEPHLFLENAEGAAARYAAAIEARLRAA